MPTIAQRFLRKWWLSAAFGLLRARSGTWPGDDMRPPDIHGEFLTTEAYFKEGWRERLRVALQQTRDGARQFAQLLRESSPMSEAELWIDVPNLLAEIDALANRPECERFGLAHSLAEQGDLPMYGMPTRVRSLYTGLDKSKTTRQSEWQVIDRDLDLAVHEFAPGSVIVKDKHEHLCVGFTGPLPIPFLNRRAPSEVEPYSPAFAAPFWMLECVHCASWSRSEQRPDDTIGSCPSCHKPLEADRARECREPLGFRTNFRPSADVDVDGAVGRHRSTQSDAAALEFVASPEMNVSVAMKPRIRTYRINRGPAHPDDPSNFHGYSATPGTQRIVRTRGEAILKGQMIADQFVGASAQPMEFEPTADAATGRIEGIWLAAPKTTAALYLRPSRIPKGLAIHRVVGPRALDGLEGGDTLIALGRTAVRAAAMSATFILVNRAALRLDIDPEEFDVMEPRVIRPDGGEEFPLLQFADHLVNGAGFCAALATPEADGTPLIGHLLRSVLKDAHEYPLNEFTRDDHERGCETGCYRCLWRYRNQPFHGLLDWRLGLAFLGAMADSRDTCGLDGDFERPALRTWEALVERDVLRLQRRFGSTASRRCGPVWAVKFDGSPRWVIIAHPLWDITNPTGVLREAMEALGGDQLVCADSFNLARRAGTIRRAVLSV